MSEKRSQNVPMVEMESRPSTSRQAVNHTDDYRRREHRIVDRPYRDTRPFPTMTTVTSSSSQRLAQHMTVAGSFLDLALFVADVEHLKYLLDVGKANVKYYNLLLFLIGASMFLQVNYLLPLPLPVH